MERGIARLAAGLLFAPLLAASGVEVFAEHCAGCHGSHARGTGKGPGLAANPRLAGQSVAELRAVIQRGFLDSGMPPFDLPAEQLDAVARYIHEMNAGVKPPVAGARVAWHAPQPGDWLTYNGNVSGNRYSELRQIDTANAGALQLKWIFPIPHFGLEVTPLEAGGVMYVSGPNQVYALDALTGAEIWKWARPQTPGLVGDASLGTNRGVAIRDDRVFFAADNARLIALDRATGRLVWETAMAGELQLHYGATLAPLVVKDTVIAGVSGADEGIRGFVACYKAVTGELLWRHWTVPLRGEPGSESWKGGEPVMGGGSTWLTGSYDPQADTLYWPTGNPFPDSEDADRGGDNLYTDSILAMNPVTGALRWHYQFTPHDMRDRDATEPPVLVDASYRGRPRKLLLHADRNGFFYVFDRVTGELLLAKPFLRRVDWARAIGPDGRPDVRDPAGCPDDAANWTSTAYSPATRLYYFLALEECVGQQMGYPDQTGQRYLRALNIETGAIAWEVAQPGPAKAKSWSGVLATAGGLVFYGKPNGGFDAVDQRSGKTLWRFPTNVRMKASPMTFSVRGKQYVAVAAGPNILCFGL